MTRGGEVVASCEVPQPAGGSMEVFRRKHRLKCDQLRYLRQQEDRKAKARIARQQQVSQNISFSCQSAVIPG